MTESDVRCDRCRFWETDGQRLNKGKCRRYAPGFHPHQTVYEFGGMDPSEGIWPETEEGEWCGEFQRKPA
ncbi:MAG: hypothetical protein N2C14_27400 [Planctomycetales bacterium]